VARSLPDGSTAHDLIIDFDQRDFTIDPQRKNWQTISQVDEGVGYTIWSTGEFLSMVNQPVISSLRLSSLREMEFACGDMTGEQIYINRNLLNLIPLMQDFKEMMITSSASSLTACLR
jgi:hypothetical protein